MEEGNAHAGYLFPFSLIHDSSPTSLLFWLPRNSLFFSGRFKPSDAKEYRRLLAQYESELLARIPKTREHMSSLLCSYKEEK